jgi:hypothetical protein
MDHTGTLHTLLSTDLLRRRILGLVHSLGLPDCWIGAGFIRSAVWDHLHNRAASCPGGDVDVLWFCCERTDPSEDQKLEARLRAMEPSMEWSVKNQARMHIRNQDAAYVSVIDAMRYWPETATAVAARSTGGDGFEFAAPFGFDDLFALVLRPAPRFAGEKHHVYVDRVRTKGWLKTWPLLRMEHNDIETTPS